MLHLSFKLFPLLISPINKQKSTNSYQQTTINKQSTNTNKQTPISKHQSTNTNQQTPINKHQSANTNQQTPINKPQSTNINQQTPISKHQLTNINQQIPISKHQSTNINQQQTSINKHQSTNNPQRMKHIQDISRGPKYKRHMFENIISHVYLYMCKGKVDMADNRGRITKWPHLVNLLTSYQYRQKQTMCDILQMYTHLSQVGNIF